MDKKERAAEISKRHLSPQNPGTLEYFMLEDDVESYSKLIDDALSNESELVAKDRWYDFYFDVESQACCAVDLNWLPAFPAFMKVPGIEEEMAEYAYDRRNVNSMREIVRLSKDREAYSFDARHLVSSYSLKMFKCLCELGLVNTNSLMDALHYLTRGCYEARDREAALFLIDMIPAKEIGVACRSSTAIIAILAGVSRENDLGEPIITGLHDRILSILVACAIEGVWDLPRHYEDRRDRTVSALLAEVARREHAKIGAAIGAPASLSDRTSDVVEPRVARRL